MIINVVVDKQNTPGGQLSVAYPPPRCLKRRPLVIDEADGILI
jgi:hypothetical protein